MSNEKADELMRDRLSGLCELPEGIHFNAGNAWNRLEAQLTPRKKKRRLLIIRAAALLTVTGGSFFILLRPSQNTAPPAIITTTAPVNDVPAITHKTQETGRYLHETDIKKHTAAVVPVQDNSDTANLNSPVTIAVNMETVGVTPPEILPQTSLPLAASAILLPEKKTKPAPMPVRPRFRIIHVNELSALAAVQPETDMPVLRRPLPFTVETTAPASSDFAEQPGLLKKKTKVTSLSDQP